MSFLPEERAGIWTSLARATRVPPKFTVDKLLPAGIVFLAGPPKSMKTTVAQALALTVAGVKHTVLPDDLQVCPEPGVVMVMNAEHSPGELTEMVEGGMGVKLPDDDSIMAAEDPWMWRLDDPGAVRELLSWLEAVKPKLLQLDPLRDFHNLDEKESGHMNKMLRPLQKWAKKNDSTLLVVHHTGKASREDPERNMTANDMRGSSAMYGLADGTITLTPKGRAGIHFSVVLKRGEAWERTIKLGIWGNVALDRVDVTVATVFDAVLTAPNASYDELATKLKLSKTTVTQAVGTLRSLKALDQYRKVTPEGPSIVANARLKWDATTGAK